MAKDFYHKKRILITGGSGFIGRHLVKRLLDYGAEVTIIDRNLLGEDHGIQCDICDEEGLRKVIQDFDPEIVFHLAASINRTSEFDALKEIIQINLIGTGNLLDILRKQSSCKAIVVAGTSEEYGHNATPFKEDFREDPVSLYSFSKVSMTYLCQMMVNVYKLPITILRAALVYGPGQEESMFVPALIKGLMRDEEFRMTKGEQTRDLIYIDDLIEAYIKAGTREQHSGEIFNVGSGVPYKMKEIASWIAKSLDKESLLAVGARDYRESEIMSYYVDVSKAAKVLGWMPIVSLKSGLQRTIETYLCEKS